jgi:hypothetical protein
LQTIEPIQIDNNFKCYISKLVIIVTKQEVKAQVFVENRERKQTTEFKYSGSVIASNGKIQTEIDTGSVKQITFYDN